MPLKPGAPVGDTIRELVHHGSRPRPMKQIIAIAEANHRRGDGDGTKRFPLAEMGRKYGPKLAQKKKKRGK